jgi:hypothetical protein
LARHRKFRAVVQILASHGSKCSTIESRSATPTVPPWSWSSDDQVEALTKCLRKLRKFKPRHKLLTGLFLFRYQMDMANFERLESLLQRGITQATLQIPKKHEQCKNHNNYRTAPTTYKTLLDSDRMVVLDAWDTVLGLLMPNHDEFSSFFPSRDRFSGKGSGNSTGDNDDHTMTHLAHNSKNDNTTPPEKVGSESLAAGIEGNVRGKGVAVKLIVHLDFEAHALYKRDILFREKKEGTFKNMTAKGEKKEEQLSPWAIRSSSVSGMVHFTVVLA